MTISEATTPSATASTTTTVTYTPRGAARRLFSTKDDEVLLDGPAGTGKSLAALYRLHLACLKHRKVRCLIVRKTGASLTSTTLVTFEEQVAAEALRSGIVSWYGGSAREPAAYRYSNGSRIVVGGMDKPDKVMSSSYDLIFADEATELSVTDWEKLGTRLRNGRLPWQQQIAACNPAQPTHWLNQRASTPVMARLISRHRDNPRYVNLDGSLTTEGAAYLGRLGNLTGVRRLRLLEGLWVAAEGLIYEEWDPSVHLVEREPDPATWTRWWTIDFGYVHPFVWQDWWEDPDGALHLAQEIHMTRRTVAQHAAQIASLVYDEPRYLVDGSGRGTWAGRWKTAAPQAVIADHDAEDRATFERETGLRVRPAKKQVSPGIQAVKKRLAPAPGARPRLTISPDALVEVDHAEREAGRPISTAEEITEYIWQVKPGGSVAEAPLKEKDDGMDGLRYITAERDLRSRYNIRSM